MPSFWESIMKARDLEAVARLGRGLAIPGTSLDAQLKEAALCLSVLLQEWAEANPEAAAQAVMRGVWAGMAGTLPERPATPVQREHRRRLQERLLQGQGWPWEELRAELEADRKREAKRAKRAKRGKRAKAEARAARKVVQKRQERRKRARAAEAPRVRRVATPGLLEPWEELREPRAAAEARAGKAAKGAKAAKRR